MSVDIKVVEVAPRPCLKQGYATKVEALVAIWQKQLAGMSVLRYYHCPFCRVYHLTSQPKRRIT